MNNWYKEEYHNRIFANEVIQRKPGTKVFLCGWAFRFRDQGGVIFIDLRDRSGIVQIVARKEVVGENFHLAEQVRSEFVLAVKGTLQERSEEAKNPNIPTGNFEIIIEKLEILNSSKTPPFQLDDFDESGEDILGGEKVKSPVGDNTKGDAKNDIGQDPSVSDNKNKQIKKAVQKQKDFLSGNIKKKKVSKKDKKILDAIDQSGMTLVKSGSDYIKSDGYYSVDTILVTKLTKELIETDVFPLKYSEYNYHNGSYNTKTVIHPNVQKAVNAGLIMGAALGRKLQIRSEVNSTKYMRKPVGKIDRRILAELSFDNENVFHIMDVSKYKNSYIHITVDASSSMRGDKWEKTMTSVVAICKAASMIDNLRVTVSFRTTFSTSRGSAGSNPYVVIAYDSSVDKIGKIKTMFPYLYPNGCTPEGLSFEAIMKHLPKTSTDTDYYFLNFSDGEPAMNYTTATGDPVNYSSEPAALHTKKQVTKIAHEGYSVLSYFIKSDGISNPKSVELFKKMYGKNASFINPNNILQVAKTMNRMFLEKSH